MSQGQGEPTLRGPADELQGPAREPLGQAHEPLGPVREPHALAREPQGPAPDPLSSAITMPRVPSRLDRIAGWMAASKLDALVLGGADLVNWVTGYSRYYGGPAAVVLSPDSERTLIVLRDEAVVAEQLAAAEVVTGYGKPGFGLELDPVRLLADAVHAVGTVSSASRLGLAGEFSAELDAAARSGTEIVRADGALAGMSLIKDPDELAKIFHAYELCWLAQAAVADGTSSGASEIEMLSAAQAAAQVGHGLPIEFGADVLAGQNTSLVCGPIAVAGRAAAAAGQPVIADICVRADGYWADTCRTFVNGSNPQVEEIRLRLDEILRMAASELCDGATGARVFGAMRDRIRASWPEGEFPHHGGHGVGLSVFDDPHVIPADHSPVASWMVMALEPGVYLPGQFGVRRENLYLVTPDGAIELSQALSQPMSDRAMTSFTA